MKKALIALSVVFSVNAFALSGPLASVFKKEVKENAKYVQYITPKELKSWMDKDKDFVILDVREPDEVASGVIDWVELETIPRGLVDVKAAVGYLKPNNTYVVVCKTGGRATLIGAKLHKLYGFKHIYVLKGGIKAWMKKGYIITTKLGEFKAAK